MKNDTLLLVFVILLVLNIVFANPGIVSCDSITGCVEGEGTILGGVDGQGTQRVTGTDEMITEKVVTKKDLKAGEIYRLELEIPDVAISHNYFSLNKDIEETMIAMEWVGEAMVPVKMRNIYQYFMVSADKITNEDLVSVELEFKVSEKWLEKNGYTKAMIVLYEYNGGWHKLETKSTGSIDNYAYFKVKTDKFTYFAIMADPMALMAEQPEEDDEEIYYVEEEIIEEEIIEPAPRKLNTKLIAIISISLIALTAAVFITMTIVNRIKHPYPRLTQYIKESLAKGHKREEVRKMLLRAGWPRSTVYSELPSKKWLEELEKQQLEKLNEVEEE